MGKKAKWFSSVKKAFSPDSKKSKQKLAEGQNGVISNPPVVDNVRQSSSSPPPALAPREVRVAEVIVERNRDLSPPSTADAVNVTATDVPVVPSSSAPGVVRRATPTRFAGKSNEEAAAILIQTIFRGYLARRALRAMRGLVRLKLLMEGSVVKRQAANTLKCMQTLSRVQSQIRARRIRMSEENQARQKQLLQKHAKELAGLKNGDNWNDSIQSKEKVEANLLSKYEISHLIPPKPILMRALQIVRRLSSAQALSTLRHSLQSALPLVPSRTIAAGCASTTFSRTFSTNLFDNDGDDEYSFIEYPPVSAHVQKQAPRFTAKAVVNEEITNVSLDSFIGQYVVLFFYPKDFTYVCPTEIIAFNDRVEEFRALNTQLIAVSCDSPESHLAWTRLPRNKGGLGKMDIPIVSDITKLISAKYGVLVEQDGVALRGLFIMDKQGVLQQITINNMPIGRSVDETLRLIKALQFVEEHGEVCPANWQPGEKTIKATPTSSYEYFSSIKEVAEDDDEAASSALTLVKTKAQFQELIQSGKPVVADFMAPWCGKCAQIEPTVVSLAEAHPEVTFAKMDVSLPEVEKLKDELKVGAYPEFRFFKDGKEVHEKISGYKKSLLKKAVEKLL